MHIYDELCLFNSRRFIFLIVERYIHDLNTRRRRTSDICFTTLVSDALAIFPAQWKCESFNNGCNKYCGKSIFIAVEKNVFNSNN